MKLANHVPSSPHLPTPVPGPARALRTTPRSAQLSLQIAAALKHPPLHLRSFIPKKLVIQFSSSNSSGVRSPPRPNRDSCRHCRPFPETFMHIYITIQMISQTILHFTQNIFGISAEASTYYPPLSNQTTCFNNTTQNSRHYPRIKAYQVLLRAFIG